MKAAFAVFLIWLSHGVVAAEEISIFYLRQIPGDIESFMLHSNGNGFSSRIVAKTGRRVDPGKAVFTELWGSFPNEHIAPYSISSAGNTKIDALNNHVLRIDRSDEGEKTESFFMVPRSSSPEAVIAWLNEFLRVFGESLQESETDS